MKRFMQFVDYLGSDVARALVRALVVEMDSLRQASRRFSTRQAKGV
jgi:hypothetical protein